MTQLTTISGADVYEMVRNLVPTAPNVALQLSIRDARYALPQLSWLRQEFRSYYRRELERLGLTNWSAEDNDCDNRADLYRVLAQVCKARMKLGDGLALAVCYIEYYRSAVAPFGMHAINAAVVEGPRLVFIEPAYEYGSDVVSLTPDEQASIRLVEV